MIANYGAMGDVAKSFPEIIKQASTSVLGIFALMILLLGCLAYVFFRRAPVKTRQLMFLTLFAGVTMYGIAITLAANEDHPSTSEAEHKMSPSSSPKSDPSNSGSSVILNGIIVDDKDNAALANAKISVEAQNLYTTSDSNGEFHLEIKSVSSDQKFRLRVSKQGYDSITMGINPPVTNTLTILLSKTKGP